MFKIEEKPDPFLSSNIIKKTHPESFFQRFHLNSEMGKKVLSEQRNHNGRIVDVLQIMLCGGNEVITELVYKTIPTKRYNEKIR